MIHYQKIKIALICLFFVSGFSLEVFANSNTVVNKEQCIRALVSVYVSEHVVIKLKAPINEIRKIRIKKLAAEAGILPMEYVITRTHRKDFKAKFAVLQEAGIEISQQLWAMLYDSKNKKDLLIKAFR